MGVHPDVAPDRSPERGRPLVTRKLTSALAYVAGTSIVALLLASPANAADAGLFGSQSPTYDGVFRQSLAITGLDAVDATVPRRAIDWLVDQQCADGSFESYRANVAVPCGPSDPENFSGPTVDATALAATALQLVGKQREAQRALAWLKRTQNGDAGFGSHVGSPSNANSTGMALIALQTVEPSRNVTQVRAAKRFLGTVKLRCVSGGGLSFLAGGPANGLASSQALTGWAGGLPVEGGGALAPDPRCVKGDTEDNVGSFIAKQITSTGALQSDFGSGPDYSSTGWAILGLVGNDEGRAAVARAVKTLETNARQYALKDDRAVPAAVGLLLLVSEATETSSRDFGGIDLVESLLQSLQ